MTKILNKQDFLKSGIRSHKQVTVPGLEGTVTIQEITVGERAQLHSMLYGFDDKGTPIIHQEKVIDAQLGLVAAAVVDEEGKPLFTVEELKNISATLQPAVDFLFTECDKVNGLTGAAQGALAKN